jgi:hypothetical protein
MCPKVVEEALFANESNYAPDAREACSARRSNSRSKKVRQDSLPRTHFEAKRVAKRQIMVLVTHCFVERVQALAGWLRWPFGLWVPDLIDGQIGAFPFSFMIWNNTDEGRKGRETAAFSQEILLDSRPLHEALITGVHRRCFGRQISGDGALTGGAGKSTGVPA